MHRILWLFLFTVSFSCSYLPEPLDDVNILLEETADYIIIKPQQADLSKAGIIFYPGGLVDPHAYIHAFDDFSLSEGRTVVILKVASNLAILNNRKASKVLHEFPEIERWVLGGHSLGGAVACMDVFKNEDVFDALFLLAGYSINDLSGIEIPIISFTGSEDLVLDQERFNENESNLPLAKQINSIDDIPLNGSDGSTLYLDIIGGNHAQFGNYGEQAGDGIASISAQQQQQIVNVFLSAFLNRNNL